MSRAKRFALLKCELICKPSSVVGNYLSRRTIADALQPHFGIMCRAGILPFCVAADRVYMAADVSTRSVSSYLAFPSLPHKRRFISVALSLRSPSAAVSRYPALCCSDFPHNQRLRNRLDNSILYNKLFRFKLQY